MPITGKFAADFASFQEAVSQTEVRLLSFEGNANKVSTALQRMADSYSGRGAIQEATLAADAVEKLGGVSTLTAAEQDKLAASLDRAIEKMKAIGQEVPPGMQAMAASLQKVPPEADKVQSAFGGMATQITATMAGMVSSQAILGAVSAGWHELTGFVTESVAAYAKQEDAEVKLTAALKQHGLATPQVIDQYNSLATTFQNTTKYADEDINAMEALLTLVGNIMPSQMQAALRASTDLAAGLGIDLEKATMLVAKAADGHIETLGRYGITIDQADFKSRGFSSVLDTINEKFGGQAAAQIETYSGRIAQMGNAWNNVMEALGRIIVEDPLVVAALQHILGATKDSDAAASGTHESLFQFAADLGIIDRVSADAADGLTTLYGPIDGLAAATAKASAGIDGQAGSVARLAAAMRNSGITEGLRIQNELVKEHEAQVKKDAEALKAWQDATVELAAVGDGWRGTLATIDGQIVEAIKYYLAAGVSQETLAKAYGLTAAQVKAVTTAIKEETEAQKAADEFEKLAFDRRIEIWKIEAAERDKLKDRVNAAVLAELAAQERLNEAAGLTAAGAIKLQGSAYDELMVKLERLRLAKVDGISQQAQENEIYQQFEGTVLKEAEALDAADLAFQKTIPKVHEIADGTAAADARFMSFKNTVQLTATSMDDLNKQLSKFYDALAAQGPLGSFGGPSGVGVASGLPTIRVPSFDVGGPTGAGGPALLHPDEFVVPQGGALVRSGGSSVVIQNLNVTQPFGTPPAIAEAVGDALMRQARAQGTRF
ncbi:MAG: hypothetical protein V4597_08550 [Pseudomonadota bacterium]